MAENLLLFIIQLIAYGLVTFFAILVMSKNRDLSWVTIVLGFLFSYISLVYNLTTSLGVISFKYMITILGTKINLIDLLCILLPSVSFIAAFILKLFDK